MQTFSLVSTMFPVVFCRAAHLEHVSPDVVLQAPVQGVQDLDHLLLLQHGEQAVQQDLQADGDGLRAVQHQAADVEHHVGVHDLHLAALVQVVHLQFAQSCKLDFRGLN